MAVRDIVTMGYGSFSDVNFIPVLGYGVFVGVSLGVMSLAAQNVFVPGAIEQDARQPGSPVQDAI